MKMHLKLLHGPVVVAEGTIEVDVGQFHWKDDKGPAQQAMDELFGFERTINAHSPYFRAHLDLLEEEPGTPS